MQASWDYKQIQVSDLDRISINIIKDTDEGVKPRSQGLRYILKIQHGKDYSSSAEVIFHEVYTIADKLFSQQQIINGPEKLTSIKNFVSKLKTAEKEGREYFETKDWWYQLKTIVCRIFGVTPILGSHEQRLIDLEEAIEGRLNFRDQVQGMIDKIQENENPKPKAKPIQKDGNIHSFGD